MPKNVNTTAEDVRSSVTFLYSDLLRKRTEERKLKDEEKALKKAEKGIVVDEESGEEKTLTKKEKRESDIATWQDVIVGLTGEDLEYLPQKKGKKKYKRWIGDDDDASALILAAKPKKKKKKNYQKEFDPELTMLKAIVTDQNRFTNDLLKRYQVAAGPNSKDAMPLNKTLVELASVINASRGNSLGILKEIGTLKKNIADLYMKQRDQDAKYNGSSSGDSTDLSLLGSSLASNLFGDNVGFTPPSAPSGPVTQPSQYVQATPQQSQQPRQMVFPKFDPASWDGGGTQSSVIYENVDKKIIVELHKEDGKARFKAIRNDTGEEIPNCPNLPTCEVTNYDEKNLVATDVFGASYPLEIVS